MALEVSKRDGERDRTHHFDQSHGRNLYRLKVVGARTESATKSSRGLEHILSLPWRVVVKLSLLLAVVKEDGLGRVKQLIVSVVLKEQTHVNVVVNFECSSGCLLHRDRVGCSRWSRWRRAKAQRKVVCNEWTRI